MLYIIKVGIYKSYIYIKCLRIFYDIECYLIIRSCFCYIGCRVVIVFRVGKRES